MILPAWHKKLVKWLSLIIEMPKCEVCGEHESKYKCPKCSKATCCLKCVKEHKLKDSCAGTLEEPLDYVPRDQIQAADNEEDGNILVQRDFNYLSRMKRKIAVQSEDAMSKHRRVVQGTRGAYKESTTSVIRRGVRCLLLPKGMHRSLSNKSKWDKPLDMFVWTVEWIVCGKGRSADVHISHRVKETDHIVDAMGKIVFQKCSKWFDSDNTDIPLEDDSKQSRTKFLIDNKVHFYIMSFAENLHDNLRDSRELLEVEGHGKPIGEILRDRTVIEFPTIYIAREPSHLPPEFSILQGHREQNEDSDGYDPTEL